MILLRKDCSALPKIGQNDAESSLAMSINNAETKLWGPLAFKNSTSDKAKETSDDPSAKHSGYQ